MLFRDASLILSFVGYIMPSSELRWDLCFLVFHDPNLAISLFNHVEFQNIYPLRGDMHKLWSLEAQVDI